ncbi:disease resistance-like protein DSC1 [Pistacia vera]|uniref:disease resistance-like protein DSC1 n=1 Tax=Pistacia vera TaxID=55513 RepID=UPI0012637250|nr:disease resistance-like protein DSC1 [Pistacia vera]
MAYCSSSHASPSFTSCFSSAQVTKKYDVFISFRGEDTRNNFTSFLYGALYKSNITVFIDNELNRGDEISPSLMNAIEESNISVIIFSEGYASSSWCLKELVKILECKKTYNQIVLPVFYHIDPSHVRNQTGTFGHGFATLVKHFKDKELTDRWRNALTEAANLSGYTATYSTSECDLLEKIVSDLWDILNYLSPANNKDLVGIQLIINYIMRFLIRLYDLRNVHTLGIWGMGGIGKTTVAEAIFNKIRIQFEASYFALNVREKSRSQNKLALLRNELLSTILQDRHSNIDFTITKRRLGCRRVLLVFDDVTCLSQIEFLLGDLNSLGPGSQVIITSRNKQVLKNCGVHEHNIYKIGGLFHCEALRLFSRYAFRQNYPKIDYDELSNRVVNYAKGVPLALKVLGSSLLDKSKEVWESAINKLEIIPHEDIQKVLKISYDGLNDLEKNIFLDIACFLRLENRGFVIEFLNACDFYAEIGISVLIDKCLVAISHDNKITTHYLLQEMGWEIVRQESTKDPGERSRLWHHEDICSVLEENTGTKAIEAICLDMSKEVDIKHLQPSALAMMRKLRFFKLHNPNYEENYINKVFVSGGLNSVSSELRYLCWHGCPLKSLQSNFGLKNLVALDMPHSNIEQLWTSVQLIKLKHIDLSYSKYLRRISDLFLTPNLETLILEGCTSLFEISSSLQCLDKLAILNLRYCRSLHSLPTGIRLKSLRKVMLSKCSNLKTFPEISCAIEELFLDDTLIEEFSSSIQNLSRLVILDLNKCFMLESLPSNICLLKSLEHLNLSQCLKLVGLPENLGNLEALKVLKAESFAKTEVPASIVNLHFLVELNLTNCCIEELPENLGQLSALEVLIIARNNFESVPTSIMDLSKLFYLDLSYCKRLQSLPQLPRNLRSIDAHRCTSLELSSSLSILFNRDISPSARVNFSNCFKLVCQNEFNDTVKDALQRIDIMRRGNSRMVYLTEYKFFYNSGALRICFLL